MLVMTVYVERIHMDVLFDLAEGLVWVKKNGIVSVPNLSETLSLPSSSVSSLLPSPLF